MVNARIQRKMAVISRAKEPQSDRSEESRAKTSPLDQLWFSSCYAPGTILDTGDTVLSKQGMVFMRLHCIIPDYI